MLLDTVDAPPERSVYTTTMRRSTESFPVEYLRSVVGQQLSVPDKHVGRILEGASNDLSASYNSINQRFVFEELR